MEHEQKNGEKERISKHRTTMEKLKNVMVTLNFNLREPKGNKRTNIYAVIRYGRKQFKIPTGCKIGSWQWDRRKQIPVIDSSMSEEDRRSVLEVLQKIDAIKFCFSKNLPYICSDGVEARSYLNNLINNNMNNKNLRRSVTRTPKATTLLRRAFAIYFSERPMVKESSKETARVQLLAFERYCEDIGQDKMSMLTQEGLNGYRDYLVRKSQQAKRNGDKRRNSNTQINNKCAQVAKLVNKVLCCHSDFGRYKLQPLVRHKLPESKPRGEDKKRRPLTAGELTALRDCQTLTPEEQEYRDLFLLECNCAYRVSDTYRLFDATLHTHIKKGDFDLIVIDTTKEHIHAVIWLTPEVKAILDKYADGFIYASPSRKGYEARMNRNLKRIAHKAGLTSVENWVNAHGEHQESRLCEIISSHYGRYTFIYTGLTKLGMTPDELARFTGHADSTMINEVYSVLTKEDKAAMACRTLQRIIPQPEAGRGKREREVIGELKNILVFLGANYEDVCDIDDEDQLCRLLYGEYEHKLMEKGVECGTLKEIYNTKGMTLKQRKELLVKTVKTLQEEINALTQ